jgi:uncharacterized protein (DUF427 family)
LWQLPWWSKFLKEVFIVRPDPIKPGPGQESVWDYPRPPRLDPVSSHVQVVFNGVLIADTRRAIRVLETSHPPNFYIPPEDVQMQYLLPTPRRTVCEWKGGRAAYYTVRVGERAAENAAWTYPEPLKAYLALQNAISFYPALMDACRVDGETVIPQPGQYYGGWITSQIVGPFKGAPGSWDW